VARLDARQRLVAGQFWSLSSSWSCLRIPGGQIGGQIRLAQIGGTQIGGRQIRPAQIGGRQIGT
jgi:hypothetical protein